MINPDKAHASLQALGLGHPLNKQVHSRHTKVPHRGIGRIEPQFLVIETVPMARTRSACEKFTR